MSRFRVKADLRVGFGLLRVELEREELQSQKVLLWATHLMFRWSLEEGGTERTTEGEI